MCIKRHLEETVENLSKAFGAILVTGARQVGKTTLLRQATKDVAYLTFDDPILLRSAKDEPGTFF
jgi:predicted AAA+ superfamily ATPase